MAGKIEYVIGVMRNDGNYAFITEVDFMSNNVRWDAGKEAITFDRKLAIELCRGLAWNGHQAQPMLKLDWMDYRNPEEEEA